jgi:hypothetical protein
MKKIKKNSIKKRPVKKSHIRKNPTRKKSGKKNPIRKNPTRKKTGKKNPIKKRPVKKSRIRKNPTRKKSGKKNPIKKKLAKKIIKKRIGLILRIIKLQHSLKPEFNFKINFSLEKYIQYFFDGIANKIFEYKTKKIEEKIKIKIEKLEKKEKDKILALKQKQQEEELQTKFQEKALKEEIKLEKERTKDIKLFLRKEQALVRIEQAERQRQFLKQLQLEKQIEKFRIREIKELEKLEKIALKEKRDDYAGLQSRIEKLKDKYRIIRDQKIRERVEALGVEIKGDEDRETLLQKEKDYKTARQKIELSLESFYRSASSLVFQLNKRHVTRHMSIFRCIDQRFETGEIFIKWDETPDEEWLLLIYIKDNSPDKGIIIEDKSNPEKNFSHEFKSNEIFKASDLMVDSLTQLISRKRSKKD